MLMRRNFHFRSRTTPDPAHGVLHGSWHFARPVFPLTAPVNEWRPAPGQCFGWLTARPGLPAGATTARPGATTAGTDESIGFTPRRFSVVTTRSTPRIALK